jgi:hypothetical protein
VVLRRLVFERDHRRGRRRVRTRRGSRETEGEDPARSGTVGATVGSVHPRGSVASIVWTKQRVFVKASFLYVCDEFGRTRTGVHGL